MNLTPSAPLLRLHPHLSLKTTAFRETRCDESIWHEWPTYFAFAGLFAAYAAVLIVDDDEAVWDKLLEGLRLRLPSITVETAHSGSAALVRLKAVEPQVILSDFGDA